MVAVCGYAGINVRRKTNSGATIKVVPEMILQPLKGTIPHQLVLSISLILFTTFFSPISFFKKEKKRKKRKKYPIVLVLPARNEAAEHFRQPVAVFYKLWLRASRGLQKRKGKHRDGGEEEGKGGDSRETKGGKKGEKTERRMQTSIAYD